MGKTTPTPKYGRTILCLANSRKMSGRCIAGKVFADGKFGPWVRPVSDREHQEISEDERRYNDGSGAGVLDVVSIAMVRAVPGTYQQENHLIDDRFHWRKDGVLTFNDLKAALDPGPLWVNGYDSYHGRNDRVPIGQADQLRDSLRLVEVRDMSVIATAEGAKFGNTKLKARATFQWEGDPYSLTVTDPNIERVAMTNPGTKITYGHAYCCVSLGEPYNQHAYKLVASVIT